MCNTRYGCIGTPIEYQIRDFLPPEMTLADVSAVLNCAVSFYDMAMAEQKLLLKMDSGIKVFQCLHYHRERMVFAIFRIAEETPINKPLAKRIHRLLKTHEIDTAAEVMRNVADFVLMRFGSVLPK